MCDWMKIRLNSYSVRLWTEQRSPFTCKPVCEWLRFSSLGHCGWKQSLVGCGCPEGCQRRSRHSTHWWTHRSLLLWGEAADIKKRNSKILGHCTQRGWLVFCSKGNLPHTVKRVISQRINNKVFCLKLPVQTQRQGAVGTTRKWTHQLASPAQLWL